MITPVANSALPTTGARAFGASRATHEHNGIDLPGREGTPVLAAAAGRVVYATREWRQGFSGYGRVVVLEHPQLGVWTLYAHLAEPSVSVGQSVHAGQEIGAVGRTQYARDDHSSLYDEGKAHLHFEVADRAYPMSNTQPRINPVAWLASMSEEPLKLQPDRKDSAPRPIPFPSSRCSLLCPSCGSRLALEVVRDD